LERTISSVSHFKLDKSSLDESQIDLIGIVKEISFLDFNKVAT
jgi:hypothetical protein